MQPLEKKIITVWMVVRKPLSFRVANFFLNCTNIKFFFVFLVTENLGQFPSTVMEKSLHTTLMYDNFFFPMIYSS